MRLVKWILGKKAQVFYSIIVLLFNILAIYYLFFFSSNKIDLSSFIPNSSLFLSALEKPAEALWGNLVFTHPTPTPSPTHTPTPAPSPIPTTIQKDDLIDCVGPDEKHTWLTQGDCDTFNNAWHVATPSAQPTTEATSSAQLQ